MDTKNSKANESNKFIYQFTDKLTLKIPNNKNIGLINLSITTRGKTLRQNATTTNLKYQHQLRMILLIYLMVLILLMIFKIILHLSLKNSNL